MSQFTMKDRERIEATVHQIDQALGGRVPRKKRREIGDELRSNLTEAATSVGADEAIRQLGDLHALISSYVEVYRGRWDFRTALWTLVVTYAVLVFVALVFPNWLLPAVISTSAIWVLILGALSLVAAMFLWMARRIGRMMRAKVSAPNP